MNVFYKNGTHIIIDRIHILCDPTFTTGNSELNYEEYVSKRQINAKKKIRAYERAELLIVSHAHADHCDHIGYFRDRQIPCIAHQMTYVLKKNQMPFYDNMIFMDTTSKNKVKYKHLVIEAFSSGHCGGALMFRITGKEGVVGFTGDINMAFSFTIPPASPLLGCDTLIIEANFGDPQYEFADAMGEYRKLKDFCTAKFNDGYRAVAMYGQALGKNQNVANFLSRLTFQYNVDGDVREKPPTILMGDYTYRQTEIYNQYYVQKCEPIQNESTFEQLILPRCTVLLYSFMRCKLDDIAALERRYGLSQQEDYELPIAIISGFKGEHVSDIFTCYPNAATIELSSHCDFTQLLQFIEKSSPKRVCAFHGSSDVFAKELRERGYEAYDIHTETYIS